MTARGGQRGARESEGAAAEWSLAVGKSYGVLVLVKPWCCQFQEVLVMSIPKPADQHYLKFCMSNDVSMCHALLPVLENTTLIMRRLQLYCSGVGF